MAANVNSEGVAAYALLQWHPSAALLLPSFFFLPPILAPALLQELFIALAEFRPFLVYFALDLWCRKDPVAMQHMLPCYLG